MRNSTQILHDDKGTLRYSKVPLVHWKWSSSEKCGFTTVRICTILFTKDDDAAILK